MAKTVDFFRFLLYNIDIINPKLVHTLYFERIVMTYERDNSIL